MIKFFPPVKRHFREDIYIYHIVIMIVCYCCIYVYEHLYITIASNLFIILNVVEYNGKLVCTAIFTQLICWWSKI